MITLNNLTFSYRRGSLAIDNANATIYHGIHLLLGENGAGKTTLLHLIAGLLTPKHGSCNINDDNVAKRAPSSLEKIFFLPENGLSECQTNTINKFARCHAPFYPNFSNEVLNSCLTEFGLTGDENLKNLSLGNRKKAALAYAISLGTDILLLDEPTTGLDITSRKSLQRMLAQHIDDSQTVIISTHTVWDLKNLFDGVAVMQHAKLLIAKSVSEISERLSFINSPTPPANALYCESFMTGNNSIIPNTDGSYSDVDFTLLYSALQSNAAQKIINILTK